MKEEQSNEIDKAFRDGLGNVSETPPPKVWNGLRMGLIERRLVVVENQNYWLKIGSGLLSAAVIVLLGLLYKGNATNAAEIGQREKMVFRDKLLHDTVYVAKTEKVYVPIKQYVYIDLKQVAETDENKTVLTPKTIANDKSITINQVENSNSKQNIEPDFQSNNPAFQTNDLSKNAKSEFLQANNINGVIQKKNSIIPNDSDAEKIVNSTVEEQRFNFQLLGFKGFDALKVFVKLPDVYFQNRTIYRRTMTQDNTVSFKNPSIKLFYAPESAYVSMITDGSLIAETIGTEKNHNVYAYGANINFDLTDKWSVETGLSFSHSQFQTINVANKRPLIAEMYKGSPQYIYRTALGLAIIPESELNTKPVVGSSIIVESEDTHTLKQFRIPLLVKYKFYEGHKMFGVYSNRYNLYSIMGAELRYNRSQILNAEIYEPDGHDFYTSFTDFKEVKPYNVGLVFGTGFEYNLARKINFYVEPTIRLSTASYSQSTIVKSFPRWWSFAFGFQYNLK